MRLNINAGGLDGFFNGVCSFLSEGVNEANSNSLINSFSNIVNKTNNLCGGVGALSIGLGYVQTRKEMEESRKIAIDNVKSKTDSFIQMALRVDAEVATMVASSQEEFYQTNPWLRPPTPPSTLDKIWDTAGDTFSKCWNGIKEFCCSNTGKIIFGVLAVVGEIALVIYIISTCGLALVPLLVKWGLTAGVATGLSLGVAGITLTSTAVAFIPNSLDLAAALDEVIDPENNPISNLNKGFHQHGWYNTTQFVANITSGILGGFYSVGIMYNAYKAARIKGSLDSVDNVIEGGIKTTKPNQVHHYATNKSKTYTPQLEEITNKYGLDLDNAWNKDLLPHQGRHPNAYHEYVLDSMKQFDEIAQGNKEIFLKLYENLKRNVQSNTDMLYKNYWNQ